MNEILPKKYIFASDTFDIKTIKQKFINIKNNHKIKLEESRFIINKLRIHPKYLNYPISDITIVAQHFIDKDGDKITDYFVEKIRHTCLTSSGHTVLEQFKKTKWKNYYIESAKRKKRKNHGNFELTAEDKYDCLKFAIYKSLNYSVCATFPYSVALTIYKIFKPRKILDMCAGWGDRLICSMIYGAEEYWGVDANMKLQTKYINMNQTFNDISETTTTNVLHGAFEQKGNELPNNHFDLMFTSPPYFNSERYSLDNEQSWLRYKTLDEWLDGFMIPSIELAWYKLKHGGFFILVINDTNDYIFVEKIIEYICSIKSAIYYGMLKYLQLGRIKQPIWVFQKVENTIMDFLDPEPKIVKSRIQNKTINIIREDFLPAGTKQRFAYNFIKNINENNLFYRSPAHGHAQVALAYACKLTNKKAHIIVNRQYNNKKHESTLIAMIFGAIVHEVHKLKDKKKDDERTKEIVDAHEDSKLLPIGFKVDTTVEAYQRSKLSLLSQYKIDKLFLVASSGLIYEALRRILPDTEIHVVLVGYKHYELFNHPNTIIHEAPERYRAPAKYLPPYPSIPEYDAKVWRFVYNAVCDNISDANNIYVFNVAGN